MPIRSRASSCAFALAVVVLVAACGSSQPSPSIALDQPSPTPAPTATETPVATATESPTPEPTATPAPTPVLVPAPLTGLMVTPAAARRHPIAVMIDDLSPARPQSGFSSASIVWQAPAEGGIPRYMMVFGEKQPTAVGPVRSSRYYYIAWAAEWKAVYAHAGGSPQAMSTLRAKGNGQLVYNADEFAWAGSFHRVSQPVPAAQPVHRRQAARRRWPGGSGPRPATTSRSGQFAPDAPLELRPVGGKIIFRYPTSAIRYDYDRATNTYLRTVSVEGKQKDAATKKRVAPKNVSSCSCASVRSTTASPTSTGSRRKVVGSGDRLDLHEREDDQGHAGGRSR